RKIMAISKEELFKYLFRSKYTFSIVAPQQYKTIADSIHGANQNMVWYRDNNHPYIAMQIAEYGITYCQYSYSLPKVITELVHLYMQINYADFFRDLGYPTRFYEPATNRFEPSAISSEIARIQDKWREKYPR